MMNCKMVGGPFNGLTMRAAPQDQVGPLGVCKLITDHKAALYFWQPELKEWYFDRILEAESKQGLLNLMKEIKPPSPKTK